MKRKINKPMRAAGALLVATMLTTCMTAGTFAKYTTTDSATDSARVAKFGVTVAINGSLFGEEYAGQAAGNTPINWSGIYSSATTGSGAGSVQALSQAVAPDAHNVVAPGTENDTGMGFSVKGKPEVDCTVSIDIEAKNIYLKKGDYAVMQTIYFANSDEYVKARATDKIYKYDSGTKKWTKESNSSTYSDSAVYCIIKEETANTVFPGDYYFPVVYTATDQRATDPSNGGIPKQAAITKTNLYEDSLSFIVDSLSALGSGTPTQIKETGYNSISFSTSVQEANRAFDADFPQEVLTWKWDFDSNGNGTYDKLDTILGNLAAQNGLSGETDIYTPTPTRSTGVSDIQCSVVIKVGEEYRIPTEAVVNNTASDTNHINAITTSNEYNLYTAVYFKATATQVD